MMMERTACILEMSHSLRTQRKGSFTSLSAVTEYFRKICSEVDIVEIMGLRLGRQIPAKVSVVEDFVSPTIEKMSFLAARILAVSFTSMLSSSYHS